MQDVVEADRYPDPAVDYPRHNLTNDLYQSDASEISAPLGDKKDYLPHALCW